MIKNTFLGLGPMSKEVINFRFFYKKKSFKNNANLLKKSN